ncbi:MBL fold metallo-hydrolase [Chitinivibrio alkaliphilus]|uniref:Metal-dependent hydrolases of the beta-lactamase superfamily I n=1 Tax=Chitinivibrio alkaliphilus ACht1 TaxID=1313304 RepID=U7DA24_9BACT|nr:MBL fold metallo-hydrolase [Chitinivibrio alkaliphilus]ERP31280.1 Metal-dependent hydrolases of the beta-lactamase superfamily I [Chitinivibrio alkaliphilus ACht1]
MKVICWGVRGSLPASGRDYAKYGGDTTCIEVVSTKGERLIIDSGTGIRRLSNSLKEADSKTVNLLLTHYHLDHIMGTPFIRQLFDHRYTFNIFGPCLEGAQTVRTPFETTISPPYFPLALENKAIQANLHFHTINETEFKIGSLSISTIRVSHTNGGALGYAIEEGDTKFVLLTDNELFYAHPQGHPYESYVNFARNADLLLHDAQFTQEEYPRHLGWGHSSIEDVLTLGHDCAAKQVGFIHYSIERTDSEIDRLYGNLTTDLPVTPVHQDQSFTLS